MEKTLGLESCLWELSEPAEWCVEGDALRALAVTGTDFWRRTHYGFVHDDGHLFALRARAPLVARVRFSTRNFASLYDQAGLMLRASEADWLKCGVELADDGRLHASAVCTRSGWSDWSLADVPQVPADEQLAGGPWVWLRTTLDPTGAVTVEASADGCAWSVLRVAQLWQDDAGAREVLVGPMCCAPKGPGFEAEFRDFSVGPGPAKAAH